MSTRPERLADDEYIHRWRQVASLSSWIAVRFAVVAWSLGALASFLVTHDPISLVIWAAFGCGLVAIGWGVFACVSYSNSNAPGRYPSFWKYGMDYREPPVFPERKK